MQLDKKLSFEGRLSKVKSKVNKTISIICKLQNALPRSALLSMHKSFIRSYLNYEDIICNKAFNQSFYFKLESLDYNITMAITGKCVFCINFSKVNHHHCFLILYRIVIRNVKREIQIIFPLSLLSMIILRIFFFLQ